MKGPVFLLMIVFLGCKSAKFNLQENPKFQLTKAVSQEIPSAIKEGNSFAKITIVVKKNIELNEIKFKGIYYKNQYANLISQDSVTYVASIILPKRNVSDKNKIPFDLKSDEIVLAYKEKNKDKVSLFKVKSERSAHLNSNPM